MSEQCLHKNPIAKIVWWRIAELLDFKNYTKNGII